MASSLQLFSLDRVKKDHIALGDNLKSNSNFEKLSKTHIAHRRYLLIQAKIMGNHSGHYKRGHLEGEGGSSKEQLNQLSQ